MDFGSLQSAVDIADVEFMKYVQKHSADLKADQDALLYSAILPNASDIVELLISQGANVNHIGPGGTSILHDAVMLKTTNMVDLLIKHGADVNAGDDFGTPLHGAARSRSEPIVRMLIANGAIVNRRCEKGGTVLQVACDKIHTPGWHESPERVAIIETLIESGADVNAGDHNTPLYMAALHGEEEIVRILIAHGADVNIFGGFYGTALQVACKTRELAIIEILTECGAEVNSQKGFHGSALNIAREFGGFEAAERLLITHGAIELDAKDSEDVRDSEDG